MPRPGTSLAATWPCSPIPRRGRRAGQVRASPWSRPQRSWRPPKGLGCTPTSPCAWRPASGPRRPGHCAGSTSTSAIRRPGPPCRPVRPCGAPYEPTKTPRPRNRAGRWGLPQMAVDALRAHKMQQADERLAVGGQWSEHDLVFSTRTGGALDAANVRREFRAACKAAKIGEDWTPRELRHSFVSLMSSSGVPVEEIARLAGHSNTRTTEVVYRRELRPVLTTGAEAMDRLFPSSSVPARGTRRQRTKSGRKALLAAR